MMNTPRTFFPLLLLAAVTLLLLPCPARAEVNSSQPFKDELMAHGLYDRMVRAFRTAGSLSYTVAFRWESDGRELSRARYKLWMKKPNFARIEGYDADGALKSTLVGDGKFFWIFWPGKRPCWSYEDEEAYRATSEKRYMKTPAPQGCHSLGHSVGKMDFGIPITILDPSIFHGSNDSLQAHIDAMRLCGEEKVQGEKCALIEVSYLKGQRRQFYWIAKSTSLPLKIKQVISVNKIVTMSEELSEMKLNGEIPGVSFSWSPPAGWEEWQEPSVETGLLKKGTAAPDFSFPLLTGGTFTLSEQKGKTVWLIFWRYG
ncbi:MAG: DUF2092 domain-containing protein [Candidatus Eremiobacteraeota bacterium]|nr:DUF2092 domain-containing protein [Candidatus Eremiobacteraeota bacterium]